ncbi:tetratricopeptide repeat protein [Candidatus Uabimicrobium sp. HlEnr_7]|uniref:tetratricopeptide repeat protein n=1 Tax=Candidatus Uabimicrobium helgolandensis TaxID=3095367 RepID=UPI0035563B59
MKKLFIVILFLPLLTQESSSWFSKAIWHRERSNHLKSWECISKIKYPNMYEEALIAIMLYEGHAVEKDIKKATSFLTTITPKLIKNKDPLSYYILGFVYGYGIGVERSFDKSLYYYKQSGLQCFLLGILEYEYNKSDLNTIIELYEKCAEQPLAIYKLGKIYENDLENKKQAFSFYEKAAKQGCGLAMTALGDMYRKEETISNREKSLIYYKKASELGEYDASIKLAEIYSHGNIVAQNTNKAIFYYKKAIAQGSLTAMIMLGNVYRYSKVVQKDLYQAELYYLKAAEKGCSNAMYDLLYMYDSLPGLNKYDQLNWCLKKISIAVFYKEPHFDKPRSFEKIVKANIFYKQKLYKQAISLYKEASKEGNSSATYRVGTMYYCGQGVSENTKKALEWFLKAREQGNGYCLYSLAYMYKIGKGVKKDEDMFLHLKQEAYNRIFLLNGIYMPQDNFLRGKTNSFNIATIKLLKEQRKNWIPHALWNLADIYSSEYGTLKDKEIIKLYNEAIELGSEHAIILLYDYLEK